MNIAIITGASSGLGMEFATQMDASFSTVDEFWLVARREDKLQELAAKLQHRCRIFALDVTLDESLDDLETAICEAGATVRMLINCAGYGIIGKFAEQDVSLETGMVRLNCEALTNITHRVIPYMKRNSRIIQIASSAAFLAQPEFAVYAATKAYVLSFSKALREELLPQGIYVTAVCPGPVETPFFDIAESTGTMMSIKKFVMAKAPDVVALALKDSYHKRAMSVYSLPIKAFCAVGKLVPDNISLYVVRKWKELGL